MPGSILLGPVVQGPSFLGVSCLRGQLFQDDWQWTAAGDTLKSGMGRRGRGLKTAASQGCSTHGSKGQGVACFTSLDLKLK